MKEGYYKIMKEKILILDSRFNDYRQESMSLFSDIQAEIGFDNSVNDQEKNLLSKLSQQLVLTGEECCTLEKMNKRFSDSSKKNEKLGSTIENCRHKIQSVRYSLFLIENEIKRPLPISRTLPITLEETEFLNDVVLFEFESFLFQVYSSLDILIYLVAMFYPCLNYGENGKALEPYRYGFKGNKIDGAGGKTIKILRKGNENDLAEFLKKRVDLWIGEVHRLRNDVAHRTRIQKMQLFTLNNETGNMAYPSLDGKDLLEYCLTTQKNLLSLFCDISKEFLLPRVKIL